MLDHHALKHGAPSTENLRAFNHFVVAYDSRLRNPRWVLERISRERSSGDAQRCACLVSMYYYCVTGELSYKTCS